MRDHRIALQVAGWWCDKPRTIRADEVEVGVDGKPFVASGLRDAPSLLIVRS